MRPIRLVSYIALCLSLPVAGSELCPYQAEYKAYRSGSELGHASQQLEALPDNQYRLTYQSHASFLFLSDHRHETSLFEQKDDNLQSIKYHYKRTGTGSDKSLNIVFNPTDQTMLLNDKKKQPWQQEQDNQLYQFSIKEHLAAGHKAFSIPVVNYRGEAERYHFEIQANEKIALPYGKINALKVARIRESKRRETFIWFAPSLDYLMVRIRQLKEGDEQADIRLSQYLPETCNTTLPEPPATMPAKRHTHD